LHARMETTLHGDESYWVGGIGQNSGGVKFDGFKDGVLLEAKGPGHANKFLDDLSPKVWFEGREQEHSLSKPSYRDRFHPSTPMKGGRS
jgi:hypothetical protein